MSGINTRELGTVSEGTLRSEDLLEAFADELESCVQDNADHWCSDTGRANRDAFIRLVWTAREYDEQTSGYEAAELVDELITALEYFAPEGAYFGAHPGDGADFGFWAHED